MRQLHKTSQKQRPKQYTNLNYKRFPTRNKIFMMIYFKKRRITVFNRLNDSTPLEELCYILSNRFKMVICNIFPQSLLHLLNQLNILISEQPIWRSYGSMNNPHNGALFTMLFQSYISSKRK